MNFFFKFFHVSDDSDNFKKEFEIFFWTFFGGGVTKGQIFFFDFSPN